MCMKYVTFFSVSACKEEADNLRFLVGDESARVPSCREPFSCCSLMSFKSESICSRPASSEFAVHRIAVLKNSFSTKCSGGKEPHVEDSWGRIEGP